MISIITAVHNRIKHNRLFMESLKKYTHFPYEIIIIDNHSTDGSGDYFESQGYEVVRNNVNICYPESMNIGVKNAKFSFLCFLNNDVYVGVDWDKHLIEGMEMHQLDAASPIGVERMPTPELTDKFYQRWQRTGRWKHLKEDVNGLKQLLIDMYGDWEAHCSEIYKMYYSQVIEGLVGNCIMVRRSVLEKIGNFDERIQAADWDFYLRLRKREVKNADAHRGMTICWSYVHHFITATARSNPEPFKCNHQSISVFDKWGQDEVKRLWPYPYELEHMPTFLQSPNRYLRYRIKKIYRQLLVNLSLLKEPRSASIFLKKFLLRVKRKWG